jgi:hypothetical protein
MALTKVDTGSKGKAPASFNMVIYKANSGNCKQEIFNFPLILCTSSSFILLRPSDVDHSQWAVICGKNI